MANQYNVTITISKTGSLQDVTVTTNQDSPPIPPDTLADSIKRALAKVLDEKRGK